MFWMLSGSKSLCRAAFDRQFKIVLVRQPCDDAEPEAFSVLTDSRRALRVLRRRAGQLFEREKQDLA